MAAGVGKVRVTMDEIRSVGHDEISEIVECRFENGAVMFYRLTNCCKASAKGVEYGTHVACRACYAEIDPEFGMAWDTNPLEAVAS